MSIYGKYFFPQMTVECLALARIEQITAVDGVLVTPAWLVELSLVDKIEPIVSSHVVYHNMFNLSR